MKAAAKRHPSHSVDISEEAGIRYLHFGSDWVQGAMRIARPWSLELEYTRDMMAGLLFRPPGQWPRRVLLVGLGAGSLAKFIYRYLPDCRITVVEINPQVEFVARQYFRLPDDDRRLTVDIACGADYMLGGTQRFDLILVDGFDPEARMGALDTLPFYQACRVRLSDDGLCAINLLGRNRGYAQSVKRIAQSFEGRMLVLPCDSGNAIAFATTGEPVDVSPGTLQSRAEALKKATRLDLLPTVRRLTAGLSPADGALRI